MSSSNSVIVVPSEIVVALSLLAILSLILNFCFLYQYTHKLVPLKNMANDLEFATKNLKTIVIRPDLLGPDKTRNPSIQFNVITEDFKQKLEPKIPEISEAPEKNTLGMNSEPLEEIQVAEVLENSGIIEVHEVSEKLEEVHEALDTPKDRAVRRSQNLEGLFKEKVLELFPPPRSEGTITPRTTPTKGQLISKANFKVFISTKKQTRIFFHLLLVKVVLSRKYNINSFKLVS